MEEEKKYDKISGAEVAQYDRQIRLWGMEAQKRLLTAEAVFHSIGGCFVEVIKNLVLAGIKRIRLQCHRPVTEADLYENYYLRKEDLGKPVSDSMIPRLQEMNSFIQITAPRIEDIGDVNFTDNPSVQFQEKCAKAGHAYFLSRTSGASSWCWIDQGEGDASLKEALACKPTSEPQTLFQEMCAPSAVMEPGMITANSIIGGLVAQEALKFLMKNGKPLDNLITFCHETMSVYVDRIPKLPELPPKKKMKGNDVDADTEEVQIDLD